MQDSGGIADGSADGDAVSADARSDGDASGTGHRLDDNLPNAVAATGSVASILPPGIPARRHLTRPSRTEAAAWAAAIVFAAVAGRFAPLSAPAEFAVLGSGILVFAWAVRMPADQRRPAPDHVDGRGSLTWLGLLLVFLTWELFAFFHGSTPAHPTLSILLGPLLAEPSLRAAGYLLWLASGAWLARR